MLKCVFSDRKIVSNMWYVPRNECVKRRKKDSVSVQFVVWKRQVCQKKHEYYLNVVRMGYLRYLYGKRR